AEVGLGDLELVDVRGALLDELDADLVRLVDEVDRHVAEQLREIGAVRGAAIGAVAAVAAIGAIPAVGGVRTGGAIVSHAIAHAGFAAARVLRRTSEASVPDGLAPTFSHFWYRSASSLRTFVIGWYVPSSSMNFPSRALRLSAATMR